MKSWNGPGVRLYALLGMSFFTGMFAQQALTKSLRDDNEWMLWTAMAAVWVVAIGVNAVRLRRIMPA